MPRLELIAAVLGLMLTVVICTAIDIDIKKVTFWTDSMNVLYWIKGQSKQYKPFVANRTGMIHEFSSPNQWKYIPTKDNPADLTSRGVSVTELAQNKLWWEGPSFLKKDPSLWPESKIMIDEDAKIEIKKKSMAQTFVNLKDNENDFRLCPRRFSDWT